MSFLLVLIKLFRCWENIQKKDKNTDCVIVVIRVKLLLAGTTTTSTECTGA